MTAVIRGDAMRLPLKDESVDLIVTSPPYFALRSYRDDGEHYEGQVGSEETPQAFLESLWTATAEMVRVLKPSGSIFVNLGDKYAGSGAPGTTSGFTGRRTSGTAIPGQAKVQGERSGIAGGYNQNSGGVRARSLMLLPERYRIGCLDRLGLIAREVLIWRKPNGLPESVKNRARRSHEDWVHVVKQVPYFAAMDEIREPHVDLPRIQTRNARAGRSMREGKTTEGTGMRPHTFALEQAAHPLGKLPGSVWTIATEPLRVPEHLNVEHFAAFPTEWPRRLILGWSPSGICVECGEGRRPIAEKAATGTPRTDHGLGGRHDVDGVFLGGDGGKQYVADRSEWATGVSYKISGYACACPEPTAETRPAVVLDPFGGTGTTAMVARALGRIGISVDLSMDYSRLAKWRVFESGHGRKAVSRTAAEQQGVLL